MHTEAPPLEVLASWLKPTGNTQETYGHVLLEQAEQSNDATREGLTPYFQSAHLDAREHFHAFANMSLHPDDGEPGCNAAYPACLPHKARLGLFGEVMAGMIAEAYEFVGKTKWKIPVFLFRKHEDAQQYVFTLSRDPTKKREVLGRKGDDFIGIAFDDDGKVTQVIAGEAKWRKTWNKSTLDAVMLGKKINDPADASQKVHDGKGVWANVNGALPVPMGLRQLQQILCEVAPDQFSNVIASLDRILALRNPDAVERVDLILLAGGSAANRNAGESLLQATAVPTEYTAGRKLQIVELLVEGGDELIASLYDGLWAEAVENA